MSTRPAHVPEGLDAYQELQTSENATRAHLIATTRGRVLAVTTQAEDWSWSLAVIADARIIPTTGYATCRAAAEAVRDAAL